MPTDDTSPDHPAAAAALYVRHGDLFVPQRSAVGPWDPDAQFGGAPAALLSTLFDRTPSIDPMHIARFTLDLLRPVPMRPLTATLHVARDGRRIQVLDASLSHDGREVARATALRLRITPDTQPWSTESNSTPVWAPGQWNPESLERRTLPGALDQAADLCFTGHGQYPCFTRLRLPVIAGEPTPAIARLAFIADFASHMAQPPREDLAGINADIALNVIRPADEGWMCIDGRGWLSSDGISLLQGLISDRHGAVATVSMTRVVLPRA